MQRLILSLLPLSMMMQTLISAVAPQDTQKHTAHTCARRSSRYTRPLHADLVLFRQVCASLCTGVSITVLRVYLLFLSLFICGGADKAIVLSHVTHTLSIAMTR